MSGWEAFQRDVLDAVRQYEGYFDFLELVGSLGDDSRPDCFGRVTRDGKREIWILDAKNKPEVDEEDKDRMENYLAEIEANPVEVGLDHAEIDSHDVRQILVSPVEADSSRFETVAFRELHQFLQKELVYTDTDRVVRDVGKMMKRGQLSHEQARMLYESIEPYRKGITQLRTVLNRLENTYTGIEAETSPDSARKFGVSVDAVLEHGPRSETVLIDVPYNEEALEEIERKREIIADRIDGSEEEVYYAAVNRFRDADEDFLYSPDELERELADTLGIASAEKISEVFEPKIPVKKHRESGRVLMSNEAAGFRLEVVTRDDVGFEVRAELPEGAVNELRDTQVNARKDFGSLEDGSFRLQIEMARDGSLEYGSFSESFSSFEETARTVFVSAVSPVLARMNNEEGVASTHTG